MRKRRKNDYEKRRLNYYDDFSGRKCKLWGRDWKHFFSLRDDKDHAHPDAYALAHPLHEEFIKRGYL